jgi:hypothetical protein
LTWTESTFTLITGFAKGRLQRTICWFLGDFNHQHNPDPLPQFPYVIFYRIEAKAIFVYSVFHTSQNPQKWMDRLAD